MADLREEPDGEWIDLGPCCACGKENDHTVRNIILLSFRSKSPGTGWGCVICHLPCHGATAVVCDECMKAHIKPKWAIDGWAAERRRIPLEELTEPFEHDLQKHQAELFKLN